MSRYIIFGAGSVGSLIGGRLSVAGHQVVMIARGAHCNAMQQSGLRLRTPTGDNVLKLQTVESIADISIGADDRIVLGMKTQDVAQALDQIAAQAPPSVSILCAQNGLDSERMALRLFEHVYGVYVYVFAAMTAPGTVGCYSSPGMGILDVGRYPGGTDSRADVIAADLRAAGFYSVARPDVMAWKRGKLLLNTQNAIAAACATPGELADIITAARQEAEACFRAAGVDFTTSASVQERAKDLPHVAIEGRPFPGGSTAQSLARGLTTTEVDFLNGEITLLGRIHGVPTPINASLQRLMRDVIRERIRQGSLSPAEVRRRVNS